MIRFIIWLIIIAVIYRVVIYPIFYGYKHDGKKPKRKSRPKASDDYIDFEEIE